MLRSSDPWESHFLLSRRPWQAESGQSPGGGTQNENQRKPSIFQRFFWDPPKKEVQDLTWYSHHLTHTGRPSHSHTQDITLWLCADGHGLLRFVVAQSQLAASGVKHSIANGPLRMHT